MHTVTADPAPFTTEPRTPTTIDRSSAADEPSHIHLPRPNRGTRPAAEVGPRKETRR
jgi:hypothetical protein